MLPTLLATRYVTPLREGGSVPAIVECDDQGLYVVKLRGAAQGLKALVAECLAAELGRALGLPVPSTALVTIDPALGRAERDQEINELLGKSVGLNFGLDYLPGSVTFDPVVPPAPDPLEASKIVWFDAFITNLDRTAKNPNLLVWHRRLWLIDHGAALYFQHAWDDPSAAAASPFAHVRHHVLLRFATALPEADAALRPRLNPAVFDAALAQVPDEWLEREPRFSSAQAHRAAWRDFFTARLAAANTFLQEAQRAHASVL